MSEPTTHPDELHAQRDQPTSARDHRPSDRWCRIALAAAMTMVALIAAGFSIAGFLLWDQAGTLATYKPYEPSRLYATPFTLEVGDAWSRESLEDVLLGLGYAERERLGAGTYRQTERGFAIALRHHPVPADPGLLTGELLYVHLADDRVEELILDRQLLAAGQAVAFDPPLLHTYYDEDRRECRPIELDELPEAVVQAVLAAEDEAFFEHLGVSVPGILRAAWVNYRAGSVRQGGSTLTQQMVKNLILDHERSLARKAREALLSMLIELRFDKERILEAYLNEIYWGRSGSANLHGIGAAAYAYFGKDARNLELAEAATLAGMIQAPGAYLPTRNPEAATARRDWVLQRMAEAGFITQARAEVEIARPLALSPYPVTARRAPYFAERMAEEARRRFGIADLERGGYKLRATLDLQQQWAAEEVVRTTLAELDEKDRETSPSSPLQAALVSIEAPTGRIRAYVGGRDWADSQFDRVAQARRQAGSVFKPIVYAAAFSGGFAQLADTVRDTPLAVAKGDEVWRPRNSDRSFRGDVTARKALELSLNVPAVRLAVASGLRRVRDLGREMGVTSPSAAVPALALGAVDLTPLDLVTVYGTLANGGVRPAPHGLDAVYQADGMPVIGESPGAPERVLSPEVSYLVTSGLRGVIDRGTGWRTRREGVVGPVAGKTGTSDDRRDSWFAGYSPERATVAWIGRDDNTTTHLMGSTGALYLWSRFTARVSPRGDRDFERPDSIEIVEIDPESGMLATEDCPHAVSEEFAVGRVPVEPCPLHGPQAERPDYDLLAAAIWPENDDSRRFGTVESDGDGFPAFAASGSDERARSGNGFGYALASEREEQEEIEPAEEVLTVSLAGVSGR